MNGQQIESPLLDTYEAARYLGLSPGTLMNWRSKGCGPVFVRLENKSIKYSRADLDQYIRQHRVTVPVCER